MANSQRIDEFGAGLSALPDRPERIGSRLVTILNEPNTRRIAIAQLRRRCDIAILNGQAGTTTTLLLAGKPIFNIP